MDEIEAKKSNKKWEYSLFITIKLMLICKI